MAEVISWTFTVSLLSVVALFCGLALYGAWKQKPVTAELGRVAKDGLRELNLTDDELTHDEKIIDEVMIGGYRPYHKVILRALATNTSSHRVKDIIATCIEIASSGKTDFDIGSITDEHINVHKRFELALLEDDRFRDGDSGNRLVEYTLTSHYALTHIKDAHLILSILRDRNPGTFDEIMQILPALKESNVPSALVEGAL